MSADLFADYTGVDGAASTLQQLSGQIDGVIGALQPLAGPASGSAHIDVEIADFTDDLLGVLRSLSSALEGLSRRCSRVIDDLSSIDRQLGAPTPGAR